MCGIVAILGARENGNVTRKRILEACLLLRHRGPDWSGVWADDMGNFLGHERLAIVNPDTGSQPIQSEDGKIALSANGEIYNHVHLNSLSGRNDTMGSDCESILYAYLAHGESVCNMLDGIFSFVLVDSRSNPPKWLAARDPIGVTPLYYGYREDGSIMFASELKCLVSECPRFEIFPPGHFMTHEYTTPRRWYEPTWIKELVPSARLDLEVLREKFEAAVVKRMMCDVPYGVLLSGGLDSSLVASIVTRHAKMRTEETNVEAWWPRVHTFSIGLEGSPDLAAARRVAKYLDTVHHEYKFTLEEGNDAISEVIRSIETYDVTTIRAGTPMYLMARKIKSMGVKMVLSGEGADEIFGGYLYFWKAPNKEEFHTETCHKLKALHMFDCARANKATAAWGVEARVPFLDKDFVEYSMNIDPKEKMCTGERIEKWMMRRAFDTPENPYLPQDVLWRQKEQFSDGVGYGWIDHLKDVAEREVSDAQMKTASNRFPHNTPTTKEAYRYRALFEEHFDSAESAIKSVPGGPSIACSTPKAIEWDASFQKCLDNSGRSVSGVHVQAYTEEVTGVLKLN